MLCESWKIMLSLNIIAYEILSIFLRQLFDWTFFAHFINFCSFSWLQLYNWVTGFRIKPAGFETETVILRFRGLQVVFISQFLFLMAHVFGLYLETVMVALWLFFIKNSFFLISFDFGSGGFNIFIFFSLFFILIPTFSLPGFGGSGFNFGFCNNFFQIEFFLIF